jgi:2'-5' RNA ligase
MGDDDALGTFGITRHAAAERMSGFLGLVLQPDTATIGTSYALAAALIGEDAEQVLGPGSLPHLTLTQCALGNVPRARLAEFVERLRPRLRGRTISLTILMVFGGGFVFWCVDPATPERQILAEAHEDALPLADGFLDHAANAAVVDATARATGGDPELVDNARRYGYAFARRHYLPHITLGFDSGLVTAAPDARRLDGGEHRHTMVVEDVVVARLGPLGRVASVLSLEDQPRS